MAEQKALKKALRQMAEGSKSGFHTFYLGSIQYIYSSARLLYDTHEDACRFVIDVYQYLYLHLPEYDMSQDLQGWLSRTLMERYAQLSIGKTQNFSPRLQTTSAPLPKSERDRLWRILDLHIHFPKEPRRISSSHILLIISACLLLLLLASRYVPTLAQKLADASTLSNSTETTETVDGGDGNGTEDDSLDAGEIDDLIEQISADQAQDENEDEAELSSQQSSTDSGTEPTITEPTIDTPTVDEPTIEEPTIEEPSVETPTPSSSTSSDSASSQSGSSGSQDLENMELELYYGDSLKYTDAD
jgi:hypothetical protein